MSPNIRVQSQSTNWEDSFCFNCSNPSIIDTIVKLLYLYFLLSHIYILCMLYRESVVIVRKSMLSFNGNIRFKVPRAKKNGLKVRGVPYKNENVEIHTV